MTDAISPISRLVRLDNVPKAGFLAVIEPDEGQRASLAREHGLLEVRSFAAEIQFSHWRANGYRLKGTIRADIVQQCGVTLEPMPVRLEVPVAQYLVPERPGRRSPGAGEELVLSYDSEDEPETFRGSRYDLGALVEELFALALDPYPRLPGAEIDEELPADEAGSGEDSPFSRLRELRPNR